MIVAIVLPWLLVGFAGWLIFLVIRQHGRALLAQEELKARLAALERAAQPADQALLQPAPAGLAPGTPAPAFALPDLEGHERTLAEFDGAPLLLVFFDPTCVFCARMAPDLRTLPADATRVLVVGRGDVEALRGLAREHGWSCEVVLEQGWEVAHAYQASGTPTGYLLDAEGRIATGLLMGADALLAVAGQPAGSDGREPGLTAESLRAKEAAAAERARAAGLPVRDLSESRLQRDGLPSGTPAPSFSLPDLAGADRSREFRGKRVLLVFSDVTCGPCDALAPDLVTLSERSRGDGLEVVMVSRGGIDANRAKAAQHGYSFPVLIQHSWEVSRAYAKFATPIGYLIDEQGVIAKEIAIGGDAILELASGLKSRRGEVSIGRLEGRSGWATSTGSSTTSRPRSRRAARAATSFASASALPPPRSPRSYRAAPGPTPVTITHSIAAENSATTTSRRAPRETAARTSSASMAGPRRVRPGECRSAVARPARRPGARIRRPANACARRARRRSSRIRARARASARRARPVATSTRTAPKPRPAPASATPA